MGELDPNYEHRACEVCGSRTDDEAAQRCKQFCDQSGEYWCTGGAAEDSYPDGRLRFKTAAWFEAMDAWVAEQLARDGIE